MKRPTTLVCVMALAACLWVSEAALLRQHQEVSRRLQNAQVVAPDVPDGVLAMTGKPMANTAATTGQTVAAATTAKTTGETTVGEPQASVPTTATDPSKENPATDALDAQGVAELETTGDVEGAGVVGNEETTSGPPAAAKRTTKASLNVKGVSGLDAEVFGNELSGVSNVQPGMTKGGKGWVSTPTDPVLVIEDAVPMLEPVIWKDDGSGESAVSAGDTSVVPAIAAGTTGIAGTTATTTPGGTTGTATTPTSTATGTTTTTAGTVSGTAPTTTTTAVAVGTSTDPTVAAGGGAIPGVGVLPAAAATPATATATTTETTTNVAPTTSAPTVPGATGITTAATGTAPAPGSAS